LDGKDWRILLRYQPQFVKIKQNETLN